MAETEKPPITLDQLRGMKQLKHVAGLLSSLHLAGCDRDKAKNRDLHFDDYVLLILLYLFNPMIDSMRILQKVSKLPEIQERLGIKRFSLGSFSESCRVFDPSMLQTVVDQLAKGLLPVQRAALLMDLPGKLTLVDSTVIQTLCTVTEAMFLPLGDGRHSHAWRLHLQLDVDHHVPAAWEITEPKNTGRGDEKSVLRRNLSAGHTYVMDRWYAQFTLWNDIKAAGSPGAPGPGAGQQRVRRDRESSAGQGGNGCGNHQRSDRADGFEQEARRACRSSHAIDLREMHTAQKARQATRRGFWPDRPHQRWHAAHRDRSCGCPGSYHRVLVLPSLDDRDLFPLLQANPGLPASAEHAD